MSNKHDLSYWSSLSLCSGCWREAACTQCWGQGLLWAGGAGGTQGRGVKLAGWVPWALPAAEPSSASAWPCTRLSPLGKGICRGGGERQGLVLQKLDPPQLAGAAPSSCRPGHVRVGQWHAVLAPWRGVMAPWHGCMQPRRGEAAPRRGGLSQPFLARWCTFILAIPSRPPLPVRPPQPSTSAPLYCKNRDSGWGAGGTPARLALGQPPVGLRGRHWLPELQQLLLQPDQLLLRQVSIVRQPLPARGGGSERGTGRAPPWAAGRQGQMPGLAGGGGGGRGRAGGHLAC